MNNKAILTRGLDGCLFLYPVDEWERLSQRLASLPLTGADVRAFSRYLFSEAMETNFDRLGRIKIPAYLSEYAKLNKEVIILGVLHRVEIWSRERFEKLSQDLTSRSEEIAEKISGTGV